MASTGVLVLTATELEASRLARGLRLRRLAVPGAYGGPRCHLGVVGVRAGLLSERWVGWLAALGTPRPLVVSAGLCGGLDPALRRADLVLPGVVIGADGRWAASAAHHARAVELLGGRARVGDLAAAAEVAATPAAKAALRARTGAVAVDMESAAILRQAAAVGCPALVVRGVSDGAGDALSPALLGAMGPDGRLRAAAVAALLARPAAWPALLRLRRATALALAAVAAAVERLIEFSPALTED